MRLTWCCLALASLAVVPLASTCSCGVGIKHDKNSSPLEVTLTVPESDSPKELVATIKNVWSNDLNLLRVGTLLDFKWPVQKFVVLDKYGAEVQAKRIHPSIRHDALGPQHFQLLRVNESTEAILDGTGVHDFESDGHYTFTLNGPMPLAIAPSTQLSGPAVTFESNPVTLYVKAQKANLVDDPPTLQQRTKLQNGCNAAQQAASTAALATCHKLALAAAADAANPNSKRFVDYFKTDSPTARKTVVDRLTAVAKECATTGSGPSKYFCHDHYNLCKGGPANAYTMPTISDMVMCPQFYNMPPSPVTCHRQDQATTILHETTHCLQVFSPRTADFAYSYGPSMALPAEKALLNADSYSLYANAVHLNC